MRRGTQKIKKVPKTEKTGPEKQEKKSLKEYGRLLKRTRHKKNV